MQKGPFASFAEKGRNLPVQMLLLFYISINSAIQGRL